MEFFIEEEFDNFIEEVSKPDFEIGTYLELSSYEDDYGNSEIEDAMEELAEKIRVYLKENQPNKFIVTTGWCVHVITPDRARKARISEQSIKDNLVK